MGSRGVTLIELLIAVTLLLMMSLVCAQMLQSSARATMSTFKQIQANQYADQIINHLRRSDIALLKERYQNFPQIITDGDYTAEAVVMPAADDGSRSTTVTVHWGLESDRHAISVVCTLAPA
jgi:prepilin-type N-terminal cleavage/methylation domain-containing protein